MSSISSWSYITMQLVFPYRTEFEEIWKMNWGCGHIVQSLLNPSPSSINYDNEQISYWLILSVNLAKLSQLHKIPKTVDVISENTIDYMVLYIVPLSTTLQDGLCTCSLHTLASCKYIFMAWYHHRIGCFWIGWVDKPLGRFLLTMSLWLWLCFPYHFVIIYLQQH